MTFTLIGRDGRSYESELPGTLGGHRGNRVYGRLDCAGALRWIARGHYVKQRVFFADQETAVAAGYRPCAGCMPDAYRAWRMQTMDRSFSVHDSPTGPLLLSGDSEALTGLWFGDAGLAREGWSRDDARFEDERAQLDEYFAGERESFEFQLRLEGGGAFEREVWAALRAIPYGTTTTYGRIAEEIGRPGRARAVGAANGRNPIAIVVPCHRVIGAGGKLTGYGGGLDNKRLLLELEGALLPGLSAERVLSTRELNRALLARQMLLERSRSPLPRALERMGFLQAQYAPSMYIGLWTRVEGLERDVLTRALERRSVVQATLLRGTIHLVSKRDFRPAAAAIRAARREWAMRVHVNARDLDERRMRAAARKLERALAGGRTLRRTEIEELVGRDEGKLVGVYVDLVRVPPSGTWERRRADLFGLAGEWLGQGDEPDPSAATEWLARRYLAAFGPATKGDFADWAGLPPRAAGPVVERVGTRRFRGEDGAELLDLPRAPLPDPETPAPVRLLPTWDATLLAHARRTQILPEEHRSRIFNTKMPQSVGTFLVDGQVAGTWRPDGERIVTEPFGRLARATRRELEGEAARLAEFCSAG